MIEVFANKEELLKALRVLEEAEGRGFGASLASFRLTSTGQLCCDDVVEFNNQLIIKGDPVDPKKNWGRITVEMLSWYKCKNGKCVET